MVTLGNVRERLGSCQAPHGRRVLRIASLAFAAVVIGAGAVAAQTGVPAGVDSTSSPVATSAAPTVPSAPIATPKIGGYVIVRERWAEHASVTATLHRVRSSIDGTLPHGFGYRLLIEYQAATGPRTAAAVSLRDAVVRWARGPVSLSAGQFKTPFSREYLASITVVETAERAVVVDTLARRTLADPRDHRRRQRGASRRTHAPARELRRSPARSGARTARRGDRPGSGALLILSLECRAQRTTAARATRRRPSCTRRTK